MNDSLFQARFAWVTMTPLGRDVLPDVNCRKQRSCGSTFTSSAPGAGPAISSIVTMEPRVSTRGRTGSTYCFVAAVVRRILAPEAFVMWATVSW